MLHDCDLCSCSDWTPLHQGAVVCNNCGFVFVPERRTSAEIAAAWDDIWGEGYTSEWPAVKARLYYVAEYLDQLIGLSGKTLLDIGAGEGTFLDFADEHIDGCGEGVVGLEPDAKNCLKISDRGLPWYCGTIEEYKPATRFDVVTLNWTLENTGDCIGVLKKARELLKPDGHICVATGSRILVPYKKPFSSYFSDNPADLHCFRWSANSLQAALIKAGFGPATMNYYAQEDWLVAVASPDEPPPECFNPNHDDPKEVLAFFERWKEQWP